MQNKNLKLKLGLCGLALTSFLAVNAHSVVHADTVSDSNANNNAITWDSDSDDSQVVKEQSQQAQPAQNAQAKQITQAPAVQKAQSEQLQKPVAQPSRHAVAQSDAQTRLTQPVQTKRVTVSNVSSSTSVSQKRAETSIVRQSNVQTSTANRLNANQSQANIKVSNVQDVAQASVQKQKVAQFNQGSKIYSLNNGATLSKNNGDGYVITNAGTYNGHAVDIGVTVNNVKDNQGSYATKWSNGDKADVTGKLDNQFNYQNSVLVGSKDIAPQLDQTRQRTEKQNENVDISGVWVYGFMNNWQEDGDNGYERYHSDVGVITPELLKQIMEQANVPVTDALGKFSGDTGDKIKSKLVSCHVKITDKTYVDKYYLGPVSYSSAGPDSNHPIPQVTRDVFYHVSFTNSMHASDFLTTDTVRTSGTYNQTVLNTSLFRWPGTKDLPGLWPNGDTYSPSVNYSIIPDAKFDANEGRGADGNWTSGFDKVKSYDDESLQDGPLHQKGIRHKYDFTPSELTSYKLTTDPVSATLTKDVQVTDHLQPVPTSQGSLDYNYTVGLYDAQTGDLITDLKPEYKSKAGATATARDSVMNDAIKNKIQQINRGQASVAYTGTAANDDVAFYEETRAVNPKDQALHKSATRIISVNLPDDPAVKDRYKGVLNANNQIVQTINFTRTGVENVVSGQVTYGAWQGPSSFSSVTLPDIPGYTMTMS